MKIVFSILISIFSLTLIHAQGYAPLIRNFGQREFGKTQPPENSCILQDERGIIYSGNAGGVLEYDGNSWNFIPVRRGVHVVSMCMGEDKRIYLGSIGEFGFIAPDTNGSMKYHSLLPLVAQEDQQFGQILRTHAVKEGIYFQSDDRIFFYNFKTIALIRPETSFHLSFVCENQLVARERKKGMVRFQGTKKELLCDEEVLREYGIFGVERMAPDLWMISVSEKGIYTFHTKTKKLQALSDTSLFSSTMISSVKRISSPFDAILVSTYDQGFWVLDQEGFPLAQFDMTSGLSSNGFNGFIVDRDKNIWAASNAGVHYIRINSPIHYFDSRHGLQGEVEVTSEMNGLIYAGTTNGLFVSKRDNKHLFTRIPQPNGHVYDLKSFTYQDNNYLLISAFDGLFVYDENQMRKISGLQFNCAIFDPQSSCILAAGTNGLFTFSFPSLQPIQHEMIGIIRALRIESDSTANDEKSSRYWVGMLQNGVFKIQLGKSGNFAYSLYGMNDGLNIDYIRPYQLSTQTVFATIGGFQNFVSEEEIRKDLADSLKGNPEFERGFFDITSLDGLHLKDEVYGLVQLEEHHFFLILKNKLVELKQGQNIDSLSYAEIDLGRLNHLFLTSDKHLLISGTDGIASYDLNFKGDKKRVPHSVIVRSVKSKNNVFTFLGNYGDSSHVYFIQREEEIPSIPYKGNSMEFTFSFTDPTDPHPVYFSRRLIGHEEEWSAWSRNTTASYTNLHEGEYTFEVKARYMDGTESETGTFRFVILAPWYRTKTAYFLYVLALILLVYIAIRISSYQLKQKNIRLEAIVQERTAEIAHKNVALEHQNIQILHQKAEIMDSITYARRIQEAILPLRSEILRAFPNSFVLFKPKDIVSGDFFWFQHYNGKSIIICADCTGHGVPGAFMSMISSDKLNFTVHEKRIFSPGAMLSEVNKGIKKSLKQESEEGEKTKDGMDAAICSFDPERSELIYAGANRPLWLVRNGEIQEYKPTKCAVGGFTPEDQIYEEVIISILPGDRVYMSTDGYADQFGGEKGKKMMVKNFKEKILAIQHLPLVEQGNALGAYFEAWKGHLDEKGEAYEQVDDVCLIGIGF
jgi:serine phosphatase RsbU (regulator of sigma subunit)